MRYLSRTLIVFLFLSITAQAQLQDRKFIQWLRSKPPIKEIVVEGARYYHPAEIIDHMYSRRRTLWAQLKGDRRTKVQRESLGRDTLEIKYMYLMVSKDLS